MTGVNNIEIRKLGSGIYLKIGGRRYGLDKISPKKDLDYNLISHAHYDHLPTRARGRVIASRETLELAKLRGRTYYNIVYDHKDIELYEAGHILGSTAFLIEGKVLYTGDINDNDRIILRGFKPPNADILIIEATYGSPEYIFGGFKTQVNKLLKFISINISRGRNIVLRAYPLGKPQIISLLLSKIKNLYYTNKIKKYNDAYMRIGGIEIPQRILEGELEEPFVLIAASNENLRILERHNPIEVILSGWTIKYGGGLPVSDHSDFRGLLRLIDKVEPKKIYTIYGNAEKFAKILQEMGYDAEPLK
ncbi:TPA: hypothetical protein EYP83_01290 [Candidatus Geothermarchaeota archaeon]|nr:hypothetical protein [Candidatus Geothermarchaeota archaeon]HIQ13231.1 hypothetical protein [Thermoprotei archaeon]